MLRDKMKLIHIEKVKDYCSTIWGLKVILFATKEEGMCPEGFGFLIHKTSDFNWLYSTEGEKTFTGYGLTLLFRPFPPLSVEWTVNRDRF